MADRDLKIEVHYDDHGAQQAVQKLDSSLEGVGTTATQASQGGLTKMSGLMKGALVGAAVSAAYAATEFVGDLMSMSEEMVRVADRTGLTTKAVQQLGYMATQSGNSLEQITTAIGQMQNRIASGDKSAVAAVQALGLNLGEIRDLSADEQFYAIGQAVASIEDPMTRTQLAMDLFGRSGAAILPTMLADMEKLRNEAPVMADETVRALEAAGDTLDWLGLKAKVAGAHLLNFFVDVAKNASQWTFIENVKTAFGDIEPVTARYSASMLRARDATFDLGERGAKPLTMALEDADRISKQLTKSVPKLGRVSGETAAEVWSLAEALRALRVNADQVGPTMQMLDGQLVGIGQAATATTARLPFQGWASQITTVTLASKSLGTGMMTGLMPGTVALDQFGKTAKASGTTTQSTLGKATDVIDLLSRTAEMSGHKTTAALLSTASATAKAFATGGPWAAAMTAASGLLTTFWKSLTGSAESKKDYAATDQIKTLQAELLTTYGSLEGIARAGGAAGAELVAAWGDRSQAGLKNFQSLLDIFNGKVKDSRKELSDLQAILAGRGEMNWETAQGLIEKYGGSLDTLGTKFTAAKLAADWKTVWDDWQTLIDMGADTGGVLDAMKQEIGGLVNESMRIGTEIPDQFKPLVAELIRTGNLFDANGKAITNISQLQFGAPLVSEVDKIIAKIDQLITALTTKLTGAFDTVGRTQMPTIKIPVEWDLPDGAPTFGTHTPGWAYNDPNGYPVPEAHTGGYIDPRGRVLHYAMGGEVPAILHSGEYVVRRQAVDALGVGTLQQLNRTGRMPSAAAPITVTITNPDIDSSVGLDRFTRRLELALDRAARRARA